MVEWKKLGDVCTVHTGNQLNRNDMVERGLYPVVNGGREFSGYTNSYNEKANSITISQGGESAGFVNWITTDFWAGAHCYVVEHKDSVNRRYLYHYLKNKEREIQLSKQGAGIPGLNRNTLYKQLIPIPPLSEQARIVEILDTFTAAIENLKQQIAERRKQYEYYRDKLLDLEGKNPREIICWGDFCEITKGNGVQKVDFEESGKGCIHYGQIYTYYGSYTYTTIKFVSEEVYKNARKASTGDLIMTDTSENVEDICKTVAYLGENDIAVSNHTFIIKHKQNPKFLSFSTQTKDFLNQKRQFVVGAKVSCIKQTHLAQIKIYLPSHKEQSRIVAILDTFEASILVLEKQLKLREKQYEYYREKLLTFE